MGETFCQGNFFDKEYYCLHTIILNHPTWCKTKILNNLLDLWVTYLQETFLGHENQTGLSKYYCCLVATA